MPAASILHQLSSTGAQLPSAALYASSTLSLLYGFWALMIFKNICPSAGSSGSVVPLPETVKVCPAASQGVSTTSAPPFSQAAPSCTTERSFVSNAILSGKMMTFVPMPTITFGLSSIAFQTNSASCGVSSGL